MMPMEQVAEARRKVETEQGVNTARGVVLPLCDTIESLQAKLNTAMEALREISSEECTYIDCRVREGCPSDTNDDGDCGQPFCPFCGRSVEYHHDPECPGEVCTARKALHQVGVT